jgi:hypothetical protein
MENMINEHDHTKKMISIIRGNLFEDESSDTISPSENDSTYKDEVKKISDSVDPRVQITKFKIYPKDRDVQFDGRLDSGINFFMSVRAMKLKISITDDSGKPTQIYLDNELLKTIQKLNGYYENWTREWAQKLNTEYKPK